MPDDLHIGVLLFIPSRAAETRIVDALHRAGYADITPAQARMAARIGAHGTRVSDLAQQAQVTKQTATALVDRLESAGWVERIPDPSDARVRLVRLGPRAYEAAPVIRAEEQAIEAEWTEHLGARRMARLREALEALREITDPYRDGAER